MALKKSKPPPAGAPEWMVTYGDMMTLLLCFFVIIVSMSEVRKDQKFQQVMDSIRSAFGYDGAVGLVPIQNQSRNSLVEQLRKVVIPYRIKKEGDSDDEGIDGRVFRVTNVREGLSIEVGGKLSFKRFSADLKPEGRALLKRLAEKIVGHNTIIQVRGHATREPLPDDSPYFDAMDLSLARARSVAIALQEDGIRPERLRIVGAGQFEPLRSQVYDDERRAENRRVEIVVTESIVDDYAGTPVRPTTGIIEDGG